MARRRPGSRCDPRRDLPGRPLSLGLLLLFAGLVVRVLDARGERDLPLDAVDPMLDDAALAPEGAMVRMGVGCGATAAMWVAAIGVTIGTVVLQPWVNPSLSGHGGIGQGLGILLIPVLAAAPVIGLAAAWKPLVGGVLGALLLLAFVALCVAVLAGM